MANTDRYTKTQFEKAIPGTGGIITQIAKKVGCTRQTAYIYIKKYDLQEAVDAEAETILDLAETKLLQNINKNDNTAIIFYLKTKGKQRGYIERQELSGAGGKDLVKSVPLTDEQMAAITGMLRENAEQGN